VELVGQLTLEADHEELRHFVVHVNRLRVHPAVWLRARETCLRGVTARLYTHSLEGGSRVVAGEMDDFIDVRRPETMESASHSRWNVAATPIVLETPSPIDVMPFQRVQLAWHGDAWVPYCYDCIGWGGAQMHTLGMDPTAIARRRGDLRGHVAIGMAVHVADENGLGDWYQWSAHARPISKMAMRAETIRLMPVDPEVLPHVSWEPWLLFEDEPAPGGSI
jgi:hypothetical protein